MGAMDRFLNAMRLNSDEDDDYYEEDDFYDEEEEYEEDDYEPERRPFFRNRRDRDLDFDMDDEDDFEDEDEGGSAFNVRRSSSRSDYNSKVTPMRASRRNSGGTNSSMEVCVIKPISVEDAREITETLIANRTVVLNLEGLDLEIAQRIIDFTSGSCYAIGGNLQKVSNYIFIVTPSHVDISGDYQDNMSAFGGSSLQMDI